MKIGGLQKISLIDYPGLLCAVIFTQGCNFRCAYCHNPELIDPRKFSSPLSEDDLVAFLEKRKGKLDAVTITGGEPTLQPDLLPFVYHLKTMGYRIKIDTNGSNPDVIYHLINDHLIDYIAMDIKGPFDLYHKVTCSNIKVDKIQQSIEIVMKSGVLYEFRTTVLKSMLKPGDMMKIGELIKNARIYYLQRYIPSKKIDKEFISFEKYTDDELEAMKIKLRKYIYQVEIR